MDRTGQPNPDEISRGQTCLALAVIRYVDHVSPTTPQSRDRMMMMMMMMMMMIMMMMMMSTIEAPKGKTGNFLFYTTENVEQQSLKTLFSSTADY